MPKLLLALVAALALSCGSVKSPDPEPNIAQLSTVALIPINGLQPYCTGVAVARDKFLTAAHCVSGDVVAIADYHNWHKNQQIYTAWVEQTSGDVAVMHVPAGPLRHWVEYGPEAKPGETIYSVGMKPIPFSEKVGTVVGEVAGIYGVIFTTAPGDSGSGVFNNQLQLIGIHSAQNRLTGVRFVTKVP